MHPLQRCVTPAILLLAACASAPTRPNPSGEALRAYRDAFYAAAGDDLVEVRDRAGFAAAVPAARVLWLGDVHDDTRLHALQNELLEGLNHRGIAPVLVLEAIGTQDEALVKGFLTNQPGLENLEDVCARIRARWHGSWLDDPEFDPFFYRGLLQFAKKHELQVFGLEPTPRGPVAQRDEGIAARVRELAAAHPNRPLVVVVGQAHLLGEGDLVHRAGLPWLAVGGEPPARLRSVARDRYRAGDLWQSTSGLFWFAEVCRKPD